MITRIPYTKIKDLLRDKKILIGILAVGIILIGGWWVWNNYQPIGEMLEGKHCKQDSDCIYGWPERCIMGCVHKDTPKRTPCPDVKVAMWSSYIWENMPCRCINNKCVEDKEAFCRKSCEDWKSNDCKDGDPKSVFFVMRCGDKVECECLKIEQQVLITTDKTKYEQGEVVKITLKNNLNTLVWYHKHIGCGYPFWWVEKLKNGKWEYSLISSARCMWVVPQPEATGLSAGEEINAEWDVKVYDSQLGERKFTQKGLYKVGAVYGFDKEGEKNFAHVKDKISIYSNEFTIDTSTEMGKSDIKIVSPNGGEKWIEGKKHTIIWKQKEFEEADAHICLVGFDKNNSSIPAKKDYRSAGCSFIDGTASYLITRTSIEQEAYNWTIPYNIFNRFENFPLFYKVGIVVFEGGGSVAKDVSDNYFNIVKEDEITK
ncbi:hypothetical protein KAU51_02560 [Candidatus Parcubacteria bacterium]|nr:hypothetical protein [Candidatus Parcubacteria bacterium]